MGDQAEICISNSDGRVYLYTHWGGSELPQLLQRVLRHGVRWGDAPYLARMIFTAMVRVDLEGYIGFGIWSAPQGGDYVIDVDTDSRTVILAGRVYTFQEYVEETCFSLS